MPGTASTLLLSKPDIAALAKVQRPVVSVWVSRYRSTDAPFPTAVSTRGREELFAGTEVVEWIRARGLGNSESLSEDLAMFAALDHRSELTADAAFHGITALLCVKAMLADQLSEMDGEDLLDETDELDPNDEFLFSEVDALGDQRETFARYVDQMADAAYTPAQAFESLMAQRFRMQRADLADSALAPRALELGARVCAALATDEHEVFVDPSVDGSDLLIALRHALPEFEEPLAMTGESDTAASRLARRRLAVHGWRRTKAPTGGFADGFTIDGPAMFLTQFPSPSTVGLSDAQILERIDNIVLQMGPHHRGVVIGPASALVDPIADREARLIRAGLLRSDRLRAAIRLPEGLLTTRPGLPMAMWVLGSADPSIKPADRWTVTADVSATDLDEPLIEAIVSDVTAAMGTTGSVRAHAFRHGAIRMTAKLLANDQHGLAPRTASRRRVRSGAELAAQALETLDALNHRASQAAGPLEVSLEYRQPGGTALPTLGELAAQKRVKLLPGHRIDASDVVDGGDIRVLGVDEVLGRTRIGVRGIDRFTFATKHPNARYTEPGDIVFCASPAVGAIVDHDGAAVVLAPARVLRVKDSERSGLIPELMARHIAESAPRTRPQRAIRSGNDWKYWHVPQLANDKVPAVRHALSDIRERRRAAEELVNNLDHFTSTLVDGLAHGVLTVSDRPTISPEKG
ncbi:MAG: hypothetical protein GX610_04310 [Rhodococcus sp.]|nr:hypothetical protein [Rhodococcus sp. (in: high G+C Gram-positive bacteria)]